MAFLEYHYFSKALEMMTTVSVLLPEPDQLGGEPLQTLYLLHGYSDDHTAWMRKSRIEDRAAKYRLCVVMPEVAHSFYTDIPYMEAYYTFVSKELPDAMEKLLPLRTDRGGRFIAGLSMGGYGAYKIAMNSPERYAGAASLSGVLRVEDEYERKSVRANAMDILFQSQQAMIERGNNISALMEKLPPEKAPMLYMACGTEDFLFSQNERFYKDFGKRFAIRYDKEPGTHEWGFWDRHIQDALDYFPIEKLDKQ